MNQILKTLLITTIITVIIITATIYFMQNNSQETQDNRPVVATTIFPVYDIARNIIGDNAEVILLIPSGASPHSYSLTPKQIISIQQAQTLFAIGHGLDNSTVNQAAEVTDMLVINVDQKIQLHTYSEQPEKNKLLNTYTNIVDPHYWLTVPNAKQISTTIANQMLVIDPVNTKKYQQNLTIYLNKLDVLEEELQTLSEQITQPAYIAVHDSWSYFTKQYHLQLVGSYEPFEGKEPSLKDIQRLQQSINQHKITTFFTEPQKPISTATKLFENEFGLNIATLDPVGGVEEDDSYIKLMRRNMQSIKNTK
jgi:zinc transport system substrate-binding protein